MPHRGASPAGGSGGTVDGLGVLTPQAYSLAPGAGIAVRYPFTVPLSAVGGLHRGTFAPPGGRQVSFTVVVRRPQLVVNIEDRVYGAGETIRAVVRNVAGSLATVDMVARLGELASAAGRERLRALFG